jgi:hypothetical protein
VDAASEVGEHVERFVPVFPLPSAAHPIAPETAAIVRDALWAKEELHERFVRDNPMGLGETELSIVASFRDRVTDRFFVAKHFAGHSIFLRSSISVGYAVRGITSELRDTLPVPSMVEATLLPFEGRIIYDGLLRAYPLSFGPGARGMVNRSYADAKSARRSARRCRRADEPQAMKAAQEKKPRTMESSLDDSTFWDMVEQATVDAYGESEQASGWFAMFENHLDLPFATEVLGMRVSVAEIDLRDDRILAVCKRGNARQVIDITELAVPKPKPSGWEWVEAYRRWRAER